MKLSLYRLKHHVVLLKYIFVERMLKKRSYKPMCIIKGFRSKFIISVLYINDMNIGTPGELGNITYCLKEKL